jgi:hypothetical protein
MKVTEPGLNKLIDNLNTLICEDSLLTRQERETLVLAVAAIGAMKARVGLKKAMRRPLPDGKKGEKRPPDPRFPRAGHPGRKKKTLLSDALDSVPTKRLAGICSGFRETGQNAFQCCFPDRGNQGAAGRLGGAVQGDFDKIPLVRPEHQ